MYLETICSKIRFFKSFLGVELTCSLPNMSVLSRSTIEIYYTSKKVKFKEFPNVFKTNEWVHSILQ